MTQVGALYAAQRCRKVAAAFSPTHGTSFACGYICRTSTKVSFSPSLFLSGNADGLNECPKCLNIYKTAHTFCRGFPTPKKTPRKQSKASPKKKTQKDLKKELVEDGAAAESDGDTDESGGNDRRKSSKSSKKDRKKLSKKERKRLKKEERKQKPGESTEDYNRRMDERRLRKQRKLQKKRAMLERSALGEEPEEEGDSTDDHWEPKLVRVCFFVLSETNFEHLTTRVRIHAQARAYAFTQARAYALLGTGRQATEERCWLGAISCGQENAQRTQVSPLTPYWLGQSRAERQARKTEFPKNCIHKNATVYSTHHHHHCRCRSLTHCRSWTHHPWPAQPWHAKTLRSRPVAGETFSGVQARVHPPHTHTPYNIHHAAAVFSTHPHNYRHAAPVFSCPAPSCSLRRHA